MSEAIVDTLTLLGFAFIGVFLAFVTSQVLHEMQIARHARQGGFKADAMRSAYAENTERRVDAIIHRLTSYDVDADKLSSPRKQVHG